MFLFALFLLFAAGCVKCEQLTQPESVSVQPGQRLSITCQASYSVSSYYTAWIRQPEGKGLEWIGMAAAGSTTHYKDSLKSKFSLSTDSSSNTATLNGQNMQPEDSAVYYCARWGDAFDYWGRGTEVTIISETTAAPNVFPLVSCESVTDNSITLGCLAHDFYPKSATFVWTDASGTKVNSHQYISFPSNSSKYTGVSVIKVPASDSLAYKCSVNHPGGNDSVIVKRSSRSDRTEPKVTVHILPEEDIEQEVTLVCLVSSTAQQDYNISWREDRGLTPGEDTDGINFPSQKTKNGYSMTSLYTTTKEKWNDGYMFNCNVRPAGSKGPVTPRGVSKAMSNAIEC